MSKKPTTAQILASFRDELAEARFDPELIDHLVRDAAQQCYRASDVGLIVNV